MIVYGVQTLAYLLAGSGLGTMAMFASVVLYGVAGWDLCQRFVRWRPQMSASSATTGCRLSPNRTTWIREVLDPAADLGGTSLAVVMGGINDGYLASSPSA